MNLAAGDVNKDGDVDSLDRMILSRHLAKWGGYDTLPYHPATTSNKNAPMKKQEKANVQLMSSGVPTIKVSGAEGNPGGTVDVAISLGKR